MFIYLPVDLRDRLLDFGLGDLVGLAARLCRDLDGLRLSTLADFFAGAARFLAAVDAAVVERRDRDRDPVVFASILVNIFVCFD